ncbi:MAG: NYN domain-containing protein [Gemmatimonadaceae bacterium]
MSKVYVFWDNSNLFIAAQDVAQQRDSVSERTAVRLHFANLYRLAIMGRTVVRTYVVGSIPPDLAIWARLERDTGAEIELLERGAQSGREQAVDAALQVQMLRALVDETEPCTAVLLTGDGAGYLDGVGFHADLERMHNRGWGIEVLSWDDACNPRLKDWARSAGVYVPLNAHYKKITFLEGGRFVEAPNFKNRACAHPGGTRTL